MTIKEVLRKYRDIEIDLLLAHLLGKSEEFIFLYPYARLSAYQLIRLSALAKRRLQGEPLAYILGYKDFYGLRFKVSRDVLIPRPETEWVIERVLAELRSLPSLKRKGVPTDSRDGVVGESLAGTSTPFPASRGLPPGSRPGQALVRGRSSTAVIKIFDHPTSRPRPKSPISILDAGTGSGAIIISIARRLGQLSIVNCQLFGFDISPAALKVARQNARTILSESSNTSKYRSVLPVRFIQSDLFANIKGKFDIITANLPYVPLKTLHRHLLHKPKADDPFVGLNFEPKFALTDGTSSWQIYRRFFQEVGAHLNSGAVIILEIDPASRRFLSEYQKKYLPQGQMKFYRDLNNLWRYAEIRV